MNFTKPEKRKPLTQLERTKLFLEHNGICCICGGKIDHTEKWIDEHGIPLGLLGSNDWKNRGPAHLSCAKEKTKDDVRRIAKAKRQQANYLGAKKEPKRKIKSRGFAPYVSNTKYVERFEE